MIQLTEDEKELIALAMHGLAARHGPLIQDSVIRLSEKLGILQYLYDYAKDWIQYAQSKIEQTTVQDS